MVKKILILVLIATISGTPLSAAINYQNNLEIKPLINKPVFSENCNLYEICEID